MRVITLMSAAVLAVAGCSGVRVVNTDEPRPTTPTNTAATPQLPPTNNSHLVNAFDYVAHPSDEAAYYFTTPSRRWQCAILPRDKAGCQSTGGAMGIAGEPDTVPSASGEGTTPNAIVIEADGDAHFAALDEPGFSPPDSAKVLPFNRTLIAARFRCNVQEATGVSCLSEQSGEGFTFSAEEGLAPQYNEVPVDAP